MNTKHVMIVLTTAVTLLSSCTENKQSHRLNYLAVQMEKNADWSIIDKDGNEVVKEEYPADVEISQVSDDGSFWVRSGGKYQLFSVEQPKKPLIDEEFTQATNFVDGRAVVGAPNTPIRIIDTKGKVVATLGTDIKRCYYFNEGYAIVQNTDNLYGVIDKDGKTILRPAYADINFVSDGLVPVLKGKGDKTWFILDMKGEKQGEINTEKYGILANITHGKILAYSAGDISSSHVIVLDHTGKKMFDIKKAPADKNRGAYYKDGYMVFTDAEGKKGIVDEKGEIQIRGRYEEMYNLGRGEFAAKKGEKWGVVNAKDETIVDFDFTYYYNNALGDYFLLRDANTWSVMNRENKEMTSFYAVGGNVYDFHADYVNIANLVKRTAEVLESFEYPKTAKELAEEYSLDIDRCHFVNSHEFSENIDDKVSISLKMLFFNNLAEEKTHTIKESDGWFTYDKTISDGWTWRTEPFSIIEGLIKIEKEIDFTNFVMALDKRLKQTHQEISEGEYSRAVNANRKKVSYRLKLEHTAGGLDVTIQELDK
jgi:hypothetical protein